MQYLLDWQQVGQNWPLCFKSSQPQNRKATMSFVKCISPSVRMGQLGSHWTDFHEIWYLHVFQKSVEKIRVSLKSDKNNSTLYEAFCIYTFVTVSRWILLRMRNFSDKSCRENQNTRFNFNIYFSRKSSRLWRTVEKYGRGRQATDGTVIRRMRFECWIPKATDTHSEFVILIPFPRRQWLCERVSILRCCHYMT
jgi:hypothetical protein